MSTLSRAKNGDEEAFTILIEEFKLPMYKTGEVGHVIAYSAKETSIPDGYTPSKVQATTTDGVTEYKIINKHEINKIKVLGKDNFKYKKMMIKKLNALAGVKPDAKALADIIAAEFIAQGYGNVNSFKCEFTNYIHSLHSISSTMNDDTCALHC